MERAGQDKAAGRKRKARDEESDGEYEEPTPEASDDAHTRDSGKGKTSKLCCVAVKCSNYPSKCPDKAFHKFPTKDTDRRQRWIRAVRREKWEPSASSVLCSDHFESSNYQVPPGISKRARLRADAIPTLFPTYPTHIQEQQRPSQPRRKLIRLDTATTSSQLQDESALQELSSPSPQPQKKTKGRKKLDTTIRVKRFKTKVNTLSVAVTRLKRKNKALVETLKILQQEKEFVGDSAAMIDSGLDELIKNETTNRHRKTKRIYSTKVKTFAFTLFYYSPKAYTYLRNKFTLPGPRTIRRWLESVNCQPGFLTDVLESVSSKPGPKLYSLVIDGMSIRKRIYLDKTSKIRGYCDYGGAVGAADKEKVPAKEALVFLLVPLTERTRQPVGFFFIDKIDAQLQASLIDQCLKMCAEKEINVVNMTCDGCATNISTLGKLGASIPEKPQFKHPYQNHDVYVTLDPAHMLKLCRNAFATFRAFYSSLGKVSYQYIEDLVKLQDEMGLKLANKVTKKHLNWKNMKMKVSLAAEVLSTSVADALQYLQGVDEKFKDAGATIDFIRRIDRMFDVLNSHSSFGKDYKSAIFRENLDTKEQFLNESSEYLNNLKMADGKTPVIKSRRKTFIIGFMAAGKSIIGLSRSLFEKYDSVKFVLGYKISQDHIETLFSKIRSCGGFNNNPDVRQFTAALKRLLVKQEVTPSPNANALDLEICDKKANVLLRARTNKKSSQEEDNPEVEIDGVDDKMIEGFDLNQPVADIVEYIAGFITRSLKVKCAECINSLSAVQSSPTSLIATKNRGGLVEPSQLVRDLSKVCEKIIRLLIKSAGLPKNFPTIALIRTLNYLNDSHTSKVLDSFTCAEHASSLCREIVKRYIRIRSHHEGVKATGADSLIRSKLTRLVIFSHV